MGPRLWDVLLLALMFLFVPSLASSASFTGKVVKVSDGDTIQVLHNGKAEKIRLAGIDCPEKTQDFGQAAKRFTLKLAAQKIVTVHIETIDRYGRTVGEAILPDGRSLNRELVRAGYAWWYRKYSSDTTLGVLESKARKARSGLWAHPSAVPPWDWRRGCRKGAAPEAFAPPASERKYGQKHKCSEMASCEEAMFYLKECGMSGLDLDGDGIPCESLCR